MLRSCMHDSLGQVPAIRRIGSNWVVLVALAATGLAQPSALRAADAPAVEQTMLFTPKHFDQDYDIPSKEQYAACKVNVIRQQNLAGWEVLGPQGQTLRRFMDTDGNGVVDQYSYFRDGMEVYRDIDTDNNRKIDQSRWLNTGGSRWAIDSNQDGRIDSWKTISPEEISQVVTRALVRQDVSLLETLLVTEQELKQLGVPAESAKKILEAVSNPTGHVTKIAATDRKTITPRTKWLQFNGSSPSVIPAEQAGTREDLLVYENAMAVVDVGGGQSGLIQLGEMVRIGNVWKLASLPVPQGGVNAQVMITGLLMQAGVSTPLGGQNVAAAGKVSPQIQKLIEQLQEIDTKDPGPDAGRAANAKYYEARLAVLDKLIAASASNADDESQWVRQISEFLTAGIQSGAYPQGIELLRQWDTKIKQTKPNTPLMVNVTHHRLEAEYIAEWKQAPNADQKKVQERWLKVFEEFITAHPATEEAAETAWRIAGISEVNGQPERARKWYEHLVLKSSQTDPGKRAVGALRRLTLQGKVLELNGPGLQGEPLSLRNYRNRFVLVIFWSTWCEPCTKELPQVLALYNQYRKHGFEVLGINLDTKPELVGPYIEKFGMTWPSIYQPKGLEGPIAREYGIGSLPTMFLVGRDGKVINRNSAIVDVQNALKNAYDKAEKTDKKE